MKRISALTSMASLISACAAQAAVPVNDAAQLKWKAAASWKSLEMNSLLTGQHQNQTGVIRPLARIEMPIEWIGVDQKAEPANPRGDAA